LRSTEMDDELGMRPSGDLARGVFPWILLKILLYALTYRALQFFLMQNQDQPGQSNAERRKNWRVANETTSLVHSVASGLWALSSLTKYPRMWTDMIEWYDDSTYSLVL
jgi:hypothetical protein